MVDSSVGNRQLTSAPQIATQDQIPNATSGLHSADRPTRAPVTSDSPNHKENSQMPQQTKADRSAAAKKGAATRKKNEAKSTGADARAAANSTAQAAMNTGKAAATSVKKAAEAVAKRTP